MCRLSKTCFQLVAACGFILLVSISPAYSLSINLPIKGEVHNSPETFTGTATVSLSGDGSLILATNTGVACKGNFVHVSHQEGNGTVTCEDGRLGSFVFVTAGMSGFGSGKIADEDFEFRIGKKYSAKE
ncbi:hypothetical protein [Desulfovibrio sp. DV]|uniref:hypothetical protein n=1 Tax=Desulfovibrio sp. DV TaxID=1844708 RepID=UPI00094BB263|nr:hypothetical protein [Desulfovibrio sp. DV]